MMSSKPGKLLNKLLFVEFFVGFDYIEQQINNRYKMHVGENAQHKPFMKAQGVNLRLVEETDAGFIVKIRTDTKLGQHISSTSTEITDQVNWIKEYKKREKAGTEYYFIFEDSRQNAWGTVRLYNFSGKKFTIGSWVCLPNNKDNIAIKAWLLSVQFGFEVLNFEVLQFDIRKKNTAVLLYANMYKPRKINEDELNYFFELEKEAFYSNREKVVQLLKIQM